MRILITGSSGFVGKHVVRELENDHDLLTPDREELNLLSLQPQYWQEPQYRGLIGDHSYPIELVAGSDRIAKWLFDHQVEAVVHLAATCGGIGINADNPGRFIYENLQMGINLLEGARLAGVKKVVNLGTVCAYPKFAPVPFKEEDIWNGYPEETNAPYGIAKKTIMEMGKAYSQQYGMDITNLVPVNMAGEWDNFDEYSSHVIPALIKKFESPYTYDDSHEFVLLWGTGLASREFLYAGDCARAIAIALEKNTGSEPINLGTGQEITICELAELVKRVGGYDSEIVWDDSKPDGQPRRCLDITRAREVLGWEPKVDLEETVRRSIEWYKTTIR